MNEQECNHRANACNSKNPNNLQKQNANTNKIISLDFSSEKKEKLEKEINE